MEPLTEQFAGALRMIEINDEGAGSAHAEVRNVLEQSETLREWDVDTILIGSYSRHTAICPTKDVDVFTKLNELTTDANPADVFKAAEDVLKVAYGDRAKPQDRSIKIEFSAEFSIDAVVAVHSGQRWAIPSPREFWSQDKRWQDTNPEEVGRLTTELNTQPAVGSPGVYVPLVKLMRQTRRHHLGKAKPGGLYFEFLTYCAFQKGIEHSTYAEIFALALRRVADSLATGVPVIDPAMNQPYEPTPEATALMRAASKFGDLAAKAEKALTVDRCQAAVLWREILGRNERGDVFPLPAGCDETGKTIQAVTAVQSRGPNEARGFA